MQEFSLSMTNIWGYCYTSYYNFVFIERPLFKRQMFIKDFKDKVL